MSTVDTSTWNPDPALNESIGDIPLNANASIQQTWQAIRMLMAAGGLHGLQLVVFDGATASADGKQGLVPTPEAGDQDKVLKGDGRWGVLSASDIPNIDASAITSGTIDLARLPAGALERLVTVADQTARYALTTASVQLGDTVKQLDTGIMYIVVDTSKLGQAAGYVEYTAGSAASVAWSGVTGKPSSYTPSSHAHGNITNDGKLGTASRAVVTDANGALAVSSVTATELGYLSGVTSAVQTQLDAKATDSGVVHLAGAETVAGEKTFSTIIVGSVTGDSGTVNGHTVNEDVPAGAVFTDAYATQKTSSANNTYPVLICATANASSDVTGKPVYFCADVKLNPKTGNIYANNIQTTSDERKKQDVSAIPDDVLDAWSDVNWLQFKMSDSVEKKGADKARFHSGVVAQRIEEAFLAHGLDVADYGLFCRDEKGNGESELTLVYAEALAMEAAFQRRRADMLEKRIIFLEAAMRKGADRP